MGIFFSKKGYTLSERHVEVERLIAEGGFSFVYLVIDSKTREEYALKRILIQVEEEEAEILKEMENHRLVDSTFVIKLIDSAVVPSKRSILGRQALLLLPLYQKGTLQDLIDRLKASGEFMSIEEALKIFKSICKGILAFHSLNPPRAFRDLKPGNVLLDSNGSGVLTDLGSVANARIGVDDRKKALEIQEECAKKCTAPYRAPELHDVSSNITLTEKTDMFSLGCTLFATIYGYSPFDGTATAAFSGSVKFPDRKFNGDTKIKELITKMIQVDPAQRPTVQEILNELDSIS